MGGRSAKNSFDGERVSVVVSDAATHSLAEVELTRLGRWLEAVVAAEFADAGKVTVMLQSDSEIAKLNSRFRDRDQPTDVLSFPCDDDSGEGIYLGDIAVSLDSASRQAEEEQHSLFEEIRYLTLHGLLHCRGYDHATDDGEMDAAELELRDRWLIEDE